MAVSKTVILVLSVLAVAAAQSARSKRQVHLGVYPYAVPAVGEDDGSYWPGKYPDDPVAPVAPVAPVVPAYPYAAPAPYAAPLPVAPVAAYPYHGADDGSYFPGKYGPESQ